MVASTSGACFGAALGAWLTYQYVMRQERLRLSLNLVMHYLDKIYPTQCSLAVLLMSGQSLAEKDKFDVIMLANWFNAILEMSDERVVRRQILLRFGVVNEAKRLAELIDKRRFKINRNELTINRWPQLKRLLERKFNDG